MEKVCYNGDIDPAKGEYFDVLDSEGHKTGRIKLRSAVHRDGDWHRAVNIWIVNGGGGGCFYSAAPILKIATLDFGISLVAAT